MQATCGQHKATLAKASTHWKEVQKSRASEKAQAGCDSLSNVAHETVTALRIMR